MRFDFVLSPKIIFGSGRLTELGAAASTFGRRAFVVTGQNASRATQLLEILKAHNVEAITFSVSGEPTVELVRDGRRQASDNDCDMVIGFGGGSSLDSAKAIAALMTNLGDPLDYLEVIGNGRPITNLSAPYIAVPTTSGTGSEVTSNAVLFSAEHRVKVSLRSPLMLARIALIDPQLTYSSPQSVTAYSGLDALTQVIEPFVSNKANPLTDALCRDGILRASWALRRAYENPEDKDARESMSLVSLYGGIALSNAKLGAVHGFAGPFGGMYAAPHGAICARLLPFVMEANIRAIRERMPDSDYLDRFAVVARLLTGNAVAEPHDGVVWIRELMESLLVPGLSTYGIEDSEYQMLIEKATVASSMQGNPIKLTTQEMEAILKAAA
ncbi:MAG: iron-containing alcohol dehydrogenase [Anaerolineae bacterium]